MSGLRSSGPPARNDGYVNNTVTIAQLGEAHADLANIDSSALQALRASSGAITAAQQASQTLQGVMKQYAAGGLSGAEQTFYSRYQADFSRYQAAGAAIAKDLQSGNTQAANSI